jgi:nickel-dependent lactate racemase
MTANDLAEGPAQSAASLPWLAWHGDGRLELPFPRGWQIRAYWPAGGPDIGQEGIERAFDNPIAALPVEDLVRGKDRVAIAVDDLSRPTPASRLLPVLMRRLEAGGASLDRVRIVLATGTHRLMLRDDVVKKLGTVAYHRLEVASTHPYDNLVAMGTSAAGTPVHISRYFAEADVRIGVGAIVPHGVPGFGGGAKIVVPGVAGADTIAAIHQPGRHRVGLANVETNEFRADVEQMVRDLVGLDCIVNVIPNGRREIAGLVVGDMVEAHRVGVELSKSACATAMPPEPVDVLVSNAYPKDIDFHHVTQALNPLLSASRPMVKLGGTIVLASASREGYGHHGLYGRGMRYDLSRRRRAAQKPRPPGEDGVIVFSPGLSEVEAVKNSAVRSWDRVVEQLLERHGGQASVAVFPCGPIQLAAEEQG